LFVEKAQRKHSPFDYSLPHVAQTDEDKQATDSYSPHEHYSHFAELRLGWLVDLFAELNCIFAGRGVIQGSHTATTVPETVGPALFDVFVGRTASEGYLGVEGVCRKVHGATC